MIDVVNKKMLTLEFLKWAKAEVKALGRDEDEIRTSTYVSRAAGEQEIRKQIAEMKQEEEWDSYGKHRKEAEKGDAAFARDVQKFLTNQFRLVGQTGQFAGKEYFIGSNKILGRDKEEVHLIYPEEKSYISRIHCQLRCLRGEDRLYLMDINSSGGTYLSDGTRLVPGKDYLLKDGDGFYLVTPEESFIVKYPEKKA